MKERLAALDFIGHTLRYDETAASRDALRKEICSGKLPWEAIVGLANEHLLTPTLWVMLKNKGLAGDLPEDLAAYLNELHQMSVERNRHLRKQLLEAVHQLNAAGIVPVLLKGARHLVTSVYPDAGMRIMTDIDLLVGREEVAPALDALKALDYSSVEDIHGDYHDKHHHCAPLFRPGDFGTVEIHRRLAEYPYESILPTATVLGNTETLEVEDVRMKALSPTHRTLHIVIHNLLIDHQYHNGIIPLRALHELASEARFGGAPIDWAAAGAHMTKQGRTRVLDACLLMAHELLGMPFPPRTGPILYGRLHYQRCRRQLVSRQALLWGLRLGRYSADSMKERYGCGTGWIAINRARILQLSRRFSQNIPAEHADRHSSDD